MAKITPIQAIRGMRDTLPTEMPYWHRFEAVVRAVMRSYGFQEIRTPMLESTSLFKRSIGEVTDIVEKEMYTFEDRNGDSLSLRPEGTASCVRACVEHGLLYNQSQRLWYYGPMFRHERPQKGRYRQFYQLGVESMGFASPEADAELILMSARLWRDLGLLDKLELQLNSIGLPVEREAYKQVLVAYFTQHQADLDEDSVRRLHSNPLRILDSKNPAMKELIARAPQFTAYLGELSLSHFEKVQAILKAAQLPFVLNPRLVRGLDYYHHTVFEWVTDQLGAQGTVCAGGRYDSLVEQLGGASVPAIGFAVGVERALALMESNEVSVDLEQPDACLLVQDKEHLGAALLIAENLRNVLPHFYLLNEGSGGKLANQFKRADKSGAFLALVLGEKEYQDKTITIKFLREDKPQTTLPQAALPEFLADWLRAKGGHFSNRTAAD